MIDFSNILSGKFYDRINKRWTYTIYIIKNKVNGCSYIGQAIGLPKTRWKQHIQLLNKKTHTNKKLQEDWNVFGKDAFEFSILERVYADFADEFEKKWISAYAGDKCYNIQWNSNGKSAKRVTRWEDSE